MGEKSMSGRVRTQKSRCGDATSEVQETGNVAGARARAKELNYYGTKPPPAGGRLLSGSCHPKGDSLWRDRGFSGSPLRPLRPLRPFALSVGTKAAVLARLAANRNRRHTRTVVSPGRGWWLPC